jgi:transposase
VLLPAINAAKAGICELFFMDAAHFVQGGVPARIWSKVRMWVKTGSGRKRFNVLGALNFVTKKVETVTNDTYIKSDSVVMMLEYLAQKYIGKPIKIILDNASYQRCELVVNKAKQLNIELLFLPAYSPNLNLIERVWKFVKSKLLGASYVDAFADYCENISDFVGNLDSVNAEKMSKLVTENFQLFHNYHVLNA